VAPGNKWVEEGALRLFLKGLGASVGMDGQDLVYFMEGILDAELCGKASHGLALVPAYIGAVASGRISARPRVEVVRSYGATCVLDGGNGLGHVVLARAMDKAVEVAHGFGVGLVAVGNSNHAGMLAFAAQRAVACGMVGFVTSGGPAVMAPWGGKEPRLGTSPFAWAIPTAGSHPIVFDSGCSVTARRRIRRAAAAGERIPEGWALGPGGAPTTDPSEALRGSLLPFGGHKGYGLALVHEVLVCALAGGALAAEIDSPFLRSESSDLDPWGIGQLALAINPGAFLPDFGEVAWRVVASVTSGSPLHDGEPVMFPGQRAGEMRDQRRRSGVPVTASLLAELDRTARRVGASPLERLRDGTVAPEDVESEAPSRQTWPV
jgi:LDH2 family malate/lactate/ureidoglycolate dehydrogenase